MTTKPQGLRALTETIAKLTDPMFGKRGFTGGALVADWSTIVGERLAAGCVPEKVVYPPRRHDAGTLRLRIASGSLALELQHVEPVLIDRINTYFGYPAVARLKLIHGPLPVRWQPPAPKPKRRLAPEEEKELSQMLASIGDPELRQVLEDLGRAVMGQTNRQLEEPPAGADVTGH